MLPAKFRLKINQARSYSWTNKEQVYTPLFKLVYRFGNRGALPKIGFIVSGKIGKATERNRVRRMLVAAVKDKLEGFPNQIEAIIIGNQKVKNAGYEEISDFLGQALSKIRKPT